MAETSKLSEIKQQPKDYQTLSPSRQPLPPIIGKAQRQDQDEAEDADTEATPNDAIENGRAKKKKKTPRRVIHCSDGIYEEYSTEEEEIKEIEEKERRLRNIDPKKLGWISWMVHYSWLGGSSLLAIADRWGERLAWFFGITSPKYYYEIEEFKRSQEEEEERKKEEAINTHGWQSNKSKNDGGGGEEIEMSQPAPQALDPATLNTMEGIVPRAQLSQTTAPMEAPEAVDFDPESQNKFY